MPKLIVLIALVLSACATEVKPKQSNLDVPPQQQKLEFVSDSADLFEGLYAANYSGILGRSLYDLDAMIGDHNVWKSDFLQLDTSSFTTLLNEYFTQAIREGFLKGFEKDDAETNRRVNEAAAPFYEWLDSPEYDESFHFSDYVNELGDISTLPYDIQVALTIPAKPDANMEDVEAALTSLAQRIREELVEEIQSEAIDVPIASLHPIKIRVAGEGLNVSATKGSEEIKISPDLLRDIYSKAAFRASKAMIFQDEISDLPDLGRFYEADGYDDMEEFWDSIKRYPGSDLEASLPKFLLTMRAIPKITVPSLTGDQLKSLLQDDQFSAAGESDRSKLEFFQKLLDCDFLKSEEMKYVRSQRTRLDELGVSSSCEQTNSEGVAFSSIGGDVSDVSESRNCVHNLDNIDELREMQKNSIDVDEVFSCSKTTDAFSLLERIYFQHPSESYEVRPWVSGAIVTDHDAAWNRLGLILEVAQKIDSEHPNTLALGRFFDTMLMFEDIESPQDLFQDESAAENAIFSHLELQFYTQEHLVMTHPMEIELLKSLVFLIAHESYHVWFDSSPFNETELSADEFAMNVYNAMGLSLIEGTKMEVSNPSSTLSFVSFDSDPKPGFKRFVLGKSPSEIFSDTYKSTEYYRGGEAHPEFSARLENIAEKFPAGMSGFSEEFIDHLNCVLKSEKASDPFNCRAN